MFEEFSPPDEGLNPGEEVIWSRRGGMGAMMMLGGGCCIVFSPWILLVSYGWLGAIGGNIVLAVIVIGILLTIVEFVNSRRTRYYLTNERIVETRGGFIQNQIPLSNLKGSQDSDTIEVRPTYREGAQQYYAIHIRDPVSKKLMVLDGLDEDARDIILKIDD